MCGRSVVTKNSATWKFAQTLVICLTIRLNQNFLDVKQSATTDMNEIKKVIKRITPEFNVPNKAAKNNANAVAYE